MTTYHTGNPIGSVDVKDLYDNAQNLDELVNNRTIDSHPDRLGVARKTWWGMEQDFQDFLINSGYESLGDYAAGIEITARNQFVWKDGELYRVDDSVALPYTTTGDWATEESSFVAIGDRVLRQNLADTADPDNGAVMIGYKAPYVGAVPMTQSRLNDLQVPVLEMFGGIGDGTTDNASSLQAAIDAGVKKLRLGAGHYRINSDVVGTDNITIEGSGPDTILDFYNGTGQLKVEGSYTALPAPAGQVLTNQAWVNFASAPDLVPGDVFFLYDPTDFSWNGARAYYRKGEFLRVHSVVGNRVNIYGGTSDSYATGTFNAYKVNPVCLNLSNLRIIESNTPSRAAVKVVFGVGVRISNVYGTSTQYTAIALERCYDFSITDVSVLNNSASIADEYGITLSNCQNGSVRGGGTSATRHSITIGGSSYIGAVPCRYINISGMTLENFNTLPADGGGAAPVGDLHSNSEFITYDNCVFKNGAALNGANNTIRNSQIFSMRHDSAGCAVYGTEITRGVLTLENCILYVEGDGVSASQGFIRLMGAASLMRNSLIVLRNITFFAYGTGVVGTTADMVRVDINTAQTTRALNVIIDGLHVEQVFTDIRSILLARSLDGSSAYQGSFLSVDNVSVSGNAKPYLIFPHASIVNIPTKEMAQSGHIGVSTSTSSAIAVAPSGSGEYKFKYSRMPSAQVSVSSSDGSDGSFVGSAAPVPRIYSISSEAIRPAALSPNAANFTTSLALRLHWRVGVNS